MRGQVTRWLTSLLLVFSCHAVADEASEATFSARCALCHQKGAVGVHGQFPRLAGRIGPLATFAQGRRFIEEVVIFGMAGRIEAAGDTLVGVMPAFSSLTDEELAGVLSYLAALDPPANVKRAAPFSSTEVAAVRAASPATATQVNSQRSAVMSAAPKAAR
jgi:mono/diheme cytochrome c family protein